MSAWLRTLRDELGLTKKEKVLPPFHAYDNGVWWFERFRKIIEALPDFRNPKWDTRKRELWLKVIRGIVNVYIEIDNKPLGASQEICKRCGREHGKVWHAPNELWHIVAEPKYNILCIDCFDELVGKHRLYWECKLDEFPSKEGKLP